MALNSPQSPNEPTARLWADQGLPVRSVRSLEEDLTYLPWLLALELAEVQ